MKIAVLQIVLILEITISTAGKNLKYSVIPLPSFADEELRCGQIKSLAEVMWFICGKIQNQGSDLQSSGRPAPVMLHLASGDVIPLGVSSLLSIMEGEPSMRRGQNSSSS